MGKFMNKEAAAKEMWSGRSLYTRLFLAVYDWLALGLHCRFLWDCPADNMLELYNQNITGNHLDVGVGTGYFLERCKFATANPRLALLDLNPDCLERAGKRVARYNPVKYQKNVLAPIDIDTQKFDSIGMMNLLHCLPGDIRSKSLVFENLKALLNDGGVIFGSTILYRNVKRNLLATCTLKLGNRMRFMTNLHDDSDVLKQVLSQHFSQSMVKVIGCVALFWCR
jgi:2-polyprenyl-3-methyl-5-hydroxy-6-metoxy-1,4-benzoquinol methylase